MHLSLIETSGNQNYIFATNKLAENIGASELTYCAGTEWVLKAVADLTNNPAWADRNQPLGDRLLNPTLNPPIEDQLDNATAIEIILATSGKALFLTHSRDLAKAIIRTVTLRALCEAPGLDICGVISEPFTWDNSSKQLGEQNKKLHQQFEQVRSRRPAPDLRFPTLPILQPCTSSGLPAHSLERVGNNSEPLSQLSQRKRNATKAALTRIQNLLVGDSRHRRFPNSISELDRLTEQSWLAVVHADGNGLGEIFLNFDAFVSSDRDYINQYRQFSLALEQATQQAFLKALDVFETKAAIRRNRRIEFLPILPLILGGDDLTVLCDGQTALAFTQQFLLEFEAATQKNPIISAIANQALALPRLSACAGIAIIKPHFPFNAAYDLAEGLIKSAKKVKTLIKPKTGNQLLPCSALDFHILYDTTSINADRIRAQLQVDQNKTHLTLKPYITTPKADLSQAQQTDWIARHHWEDFRERVVALSDRQDGRATLPTSQMHQLRESLFQGRTAADALLNLIYNRYKIGLKSLVNPTLTPSLFIEDNNGETPVYATGFLDALDAVDFL